MSDKPTTTKTRVISPAIAALRAEHKARVEELKKTEASAVILKRIVEELISKLTPKDQKFLFDHMAAHLKP